MTEEISLSSFSPSDREWLDILLADKDVRKYLSNLTSDVDVFVHDMEIAERTGLGILWIVRFAERGIGFISIYDLTENPFVFYAMLSSFRNKGYMKRAIKLMERLGLPSLSTKVENDNIASLNVLMPSTIRIV